MLIHVKPFQCSRRAYRKVPFSEAEPNIPHFIYYRNARDQQYKYISRETALEVAARNGTDSYDPFNFCSPLSSLTLNSRNVEEILNSYQREAARSYPMS